MLITAGVKEDFKECGNDFGTKRPFLKIKQPVGI